MINRKPTHYAGLDHSGPCKVLPPTFLGVRNLVEKVGQSMAEKMYSQPDDVEDDESKDLVREFLSELTYADKVERQALIQEFSSMVTDLQKAQESPKEEPPKEEPPKEEPPKEEPPKD